MSYPYTVIDDKNFVKANSDNVKNVESNYDDGYMFCTQKIPKHSSLIMIPVIGPIADALMISNKDWITGQNFVLSSLVPVFGGLHTYLSDTQCIFNSYYLEKYNKVVEQGLTKKEIDDKFYKPKKAIHHAFVDQAINQSDENCNKYQTLIKASKGEFSMGVDSMGTVGSAASGIAGIAGNGATSGGLSAANLILKGLSSDVDNIIYNGNDLDLIFKTANSTRQVLKKCLYNHELTECQDHKDWHMQKAESANCKTETKETKGTETSNINKKETDQKTKISSDIKTDETRKTTKTEVVNDCKTDTNVPVASGSTWMEQSEFIDFMNAYDKACFLPNAKINSQERLDAANGTVTDGKNSSPALQKQDAANTK